jgi:hypothetical protein
LDQSASGNSIMGLRVVSPYSNVASLQCATHASPAREG